MNGFLKSAQFYRLSCCRRIINLPSHTRMRMHIDLIFREPPSWMKQGSQHLDRAPSLQSVNMLFKDSRLKRETRWRKLESSGTCSRISYCKAAQPNLRDSESQDMHTSHLCFPLHDRPHQLQRFCCKCHHVRISVSGQAGVHLL